MDRDRSRLLQQLNQKVGLISCDFLKAVANSGVDVDFMALFCRDGTTSELQTTREHVEEQFQASASNDTRHNNRRKRQREEEDRNEEWMNRLEQINRINMDRAIQAFEDLAASMKEHTAAILREQREQQAAALASFEEIIREFDERWMSFLASNGTSTNGNNSQSTDNSSEKN
jgi:hypothetical protein